MRLRGAVEATAAKIIKPVLVSPEARIRRLAVSLDLDRCAAPIKHISPMVAGNADILLVPNLEAGNMLVKKLSFLANADAAGIVVGAQVPIILTGRADNAHTQMASCAVLALYAHIHRVAGANIGKLAD